MSKHQITPWCISDSGRLIIDADMNLIADCGNFSCVAEEAKANAAHIVHCVNTYPDLVKALEVTRAYFNKFLLDEIEEKSSCVDDDHFIETNKAFNFVSAALAKARKG